MQKSKWLRLGILSGAFLLLSAGKSYAAGWVEEEGAWKYQNNAGAYVSNSWVQSGDDWYFLGADDIMQISGFVESGNALYYVDENGKRVKERWVAAVDETDENAKIWYYFDADGKAVKGREGRVSTKQIGDARYIFDAEGRMQTGYLTETGEQVEADGEYRFLNARYYADESGAVYINRWLRYTDVGENGLYSQLAQRNYNEYEELWVFFDERGRKVVARDLTAPRQKLINGAIYTFDENGVMIPGLAISNATAPATTSNNTIRYGSADTDGAQYSDYWTFRVPNEEMDAEDYHNQEYSWFRTKKDGRVIKNRIAEVLGRKYAFDRIGRMQTGFVIMYRDDGSFGAQYDIDDWGSEDFLIGKDGANGSLLYPLERGNLYLFGVDELNDGSMKTGEEISVILADGPAVFGFRPNGIAYGNRYTLERKNNKYYYNGLRLDAGEDVGYATIKDPRFGTDAYVVVDTLGRPVKGKKRVLADNEGNWILIKNDRFYARVSSGEKPRWKDDSFYFYDSTQPKESRFSAAPIPMNTGATEIEIRYGHQYDH